MSVEELRSLGISCPDKGKLIVAINSKWCSACKTLALILKKFKSSGLIELVEIDVNSYPSICKKFQITAVPALLFFKDGFLINKDIEINDFPFVKKGLMIGINCEEILTEILEQI